MRFSSIALALALAAGIPSAACGGVCQPVTAAPVTAVDAPELPARLSRVETTLTADITAPLEMARAALPPVFRTSDNNGTAWDGGNSDQGWLYLDSQFRPSSAAAAAFRARAEIVRVSADYMLSGSSIAFTAAFRYRVHAQGRVGPFFAGGYCGTDNKAVIPLTVRGQTNVGVTPSWTLAAQTHLAVDQMGPCEITIAGINVAPHLTAQLRSLVDGQVLTAIARRMDAELAAIDLRSAVASAWESVQQPFQASPFHVALHPEGLILGDLVASGTSVGAPPRASISAAVGIVARPTVTIAAPQLDSMPLPDARPDAGGGFFVEAALELSFGEVDAALARLRGRTFSIDGSDLEIEQVSVRPAGSGQLAIEVAFSGSCKHAFCGTVTLVGTPTVDAMAQTVSFPDLDFASTTDSLLLDAYAWLNKAALRDLLRAAVRFSWNDEMTQLEAGLVREAAAHHLQLTVDQRDVAGVRVARTLRVVFVLSGAAKLEPITLP